MNVTLKDPSKSFAHHALDHLKAVLLFHLVNPIDDVISILAQKSVDVRLHIISKQIVWEIQNSHYW